MSLPEQIQKQLDASKLIIEQHYGPAAGGSEDPADQGQPNGENTQDPQENSPEPVTQNPVAATAQQPGESDESYAQRWRSLQGIYNATQRQLEQERRRSQDLERVLASVTSQRQAPAEQQPQMPQFLTEKDSSEYGADMVDFARRAAREEVAPLIGAIQALRQEVASLKGVVPAIRSVAANQNRTQEEQFFERLSTRVPQWQAINGNGAFHDWLLSPDPMTGITRQTYLEDAQKSFNLDRVVSIFQQWATVSGMPAETPQQRQTQERPNSAAGELQRQVAPGKATAGTTPPQRNGRQWSPSQITKFYDDVRRGEYKNRPEEKMKLEQDLFLAQREGRVVRDAA